MEEVKELAKQIPGEECSKQKTQSKGPKVEMYMLYSRNCGETVSEKGKEEQPIQ